MIAEFEGEYRFLSNFWPASVVYEGKLYPSTEHAYQAAKTHNADIREKIANTPTPDKAKYLGKSLKLRSDWENVKDDVMRELVSQKFTVHPELKQKLIDTGDQELIEGNTWNDTYWGVCRGKGQNKLGKILMDIRKQLNEH